MYRIKNRYGNILNVALATNVIKLPTYETSGLENISKQSQHMAKILNCEVVEPVNKLSETMNKTFGQMQEILGKQLPIYEVIHRIASGKFIESPNVKPRVTMSQAVRIRLVYYRRCNA